VFPTGALLAEAPKRGDLRVGCAAVQTLVHRELAIADHSRQA